MLFSKLPLNLFLAQPPERNQFDSPPECLPGRLPNIIGISNHGVGNTLDNGLAQGPGGYLAVGVHGVATASAQIEGGWNQDGRGPSIWDIFCRQEGNVLNGDTTSQACDFYNRWHDDIALMSKLGLQAFRFSISWSRIFPDGTGEINQAGLDFYSQLVDALLANGIRPYVTLYHWDLPHALQLKGGWLNRDIADWFTCYTETLVQCLGDRVKDWITFNEPQIFLGFGYSDGTHASGLSLPHEEVFHAAHNVNLAHGRATKKIREFVKDAKVGIAIATKIGIPADEHDPDHIEAARKATIHPEWKDGRDKHTTYLNNAWWPDPMIHGRYPEILEKHLPGFLDQFPASDMEEICQPLDFFGFNYYFGVVVEPADNEQGWRALPEKAGEPRTMIGWPVHPSGLYWASRFFYDEYQLPLYVFENGLSSMDWVDTKGKVKDHQRIDFLTRYLTQYSRAHQDKIPLAGYFHWSLMDNFEWAQGYRERFGLIHVDYQTLKRTPKASAFWYQKVIQSNGTHLFSPSIT